jgi:hypothetical protein
VGDVGVCTLCNRLRGTGTSPLKLKPGLSGLPVPAVARDSPGCADVFSGSAPSARPPRSSRPLFPSGERAVKRGNLELCFSNSRVIFPPQYC